MRMNLSGVHRMRRTGILFGESLPPPGKRCGVCAIPDEHPRSRGRPTKPGSFLLGQFWDSKTEKEPGSTVE